MAIFRFSWLAVAVLACLLGCARPARVDIRAEANAIRELDRLWLAAEVAQDAAAASSFFASDAIEMPANGPSVVGKKAIQAWYAEWLGTPDMSVSFSPEVIEVAASGDMAYDRGAYRFATGGAQGHIEDVGKYLTIWKKIDGEWKVIVDTANSNQPAPTP